MILQSIVSNDKGSNQSLPTNTLKYLAYVEQQNKGNIETNIVKKYKNGSWIEEKQTQIVITVDKNKGKTKKRNNKKLYYQLFNVTQRSKFIEDKELQFSDGRYFVKCLDAYKPKYELLEEMAI